MTTEWMPENPCKGCADPIPCETCRAKANYDTTIEAQKKVLEWLLADCKNIYDHNLYPTIGKVQLESMLSQLEASKCCY